MSAGLMLYLIAFVGGLLTIVSPCILPVLPFVLARADQPFRRSGLPLLIGMGLTFAALGAVATVAGDWIVRANQLGRTVAMLLFAVFGLALLFPALADSLARPFVRLGGAVQLRGDAKSTLGGSVVLGVSTGLLWTPCAGPILGLILAAAAVEGGTRSVGLLLAFAAGSVSALALVLLAGQRVFQMLKKSLGAEVWIRRMLGVAVLVGVVGIALGWDTGVLARISLTSGASATSLEQRLVDRIRPPETAPRVEAPISMQAAVPPAMMQAAPRMEAPAIMQAATMSAQGRGGAAVSEGPMPSLDGAVQWLNGPPQTRDGLRGKVVLIDFWTYSCINCLRSIPYVQAWADKYKDAGLVVIGDHAPEFAFERDLGNVTKAVKDLKITYPVAVDSNRKIWNAFHNQIWPAHYFVDAQGRIRAHHFGEGNYEESERVIQTLLAERNAGAPASDFVRVAATGAQAAPNLAAVRSPETYVGYERLENYASPEEIAKDREERYSPPVRPRVNQWGLAGWWNVGGEHAVLGSAPGKIVFRFHARDLHLVLGPRRGGRSVRFRVLLDGAPPLDDGGVDVDKQGNGVVSEYRLFQLIRQKGAVEDRTFQIEFLDPGVEAFAFTFG
jgi:cytochrome c biogenesis protein CcdA/thiol-disulfide isomerase/thioredoxin